MSDKIFVDGMIVKRRENAPDFVVASLSIKAREMLEFMKAHHKDGWLNIDIKTARSGKMYAELDTWEPTQKEAHEQGMQQARQAMGDDFDSEIPF
jgi:hypothetical protein